MQRLTEITCPISYILDVKSYGAFGFDPHMSPEQAHERATQLNPQASIGRDDARKLATVARVKNIDRIKSAYLPTEQCEEFERTTLFKRFARGSFESPRYLKAISHWAYVQRMIAELTERGQAKDPSVWSEEAGDFYLYFCSRRTSPKYVTKLIKVLNLWGAFTCRRLSLPFLAVACPRGYERAQIEDAYFGAKGRGTESDPLKPEALESGRRKLIVPGQYEWLYVSVQFGLRPKEIDELSDSTTWEVFRDRASGVDVLRIYQGKLKTISRDKRYKAIPIIYPEQDRALEFVRRGGLKRPLRKTLEKVFAGHITTYGGRKGFTDMMLDRGQAPEDISMWLGHKSIETTWKHHKDRSVVRFKKPGKAA
jgi:hypothetical protein